MLNKRFICNLHNISQRYAHTKVPSKTTCLNEFHKKQQAKFVDFAGYSMPVQYADLSIPQSTLHTRNHVSIFDVSHMLQTEIHGKDGIAFLESLTPADIQGLKEDTGCLSVFTNEKGGIKDDLVVSKTSSGHLYVVSNAGCADKDLAHLQLNAETWRHKGKDVQVKEISPQYGLIAVQGPEAVRLLEQDVDTDLSKLYFMQTARTTVFGIEGCQLTRCGYTGEDGFEISFPIAEADNLLNRLIESQKAEVRMAGLGARNVLRLEAGLCLYGDDITEDTTPIEAQLNFVVAKRRRQTLDFPGADIIVQQINDKRVPKKRVGLVNEGGRPPRGHIPINDPIDKAVVGFVTSGCPSPTLNKNIAMGYVDFADSTPGKVLDADFGSKTVKVTVTKLPFQKSNYYTKPKSA